MKLRTIDTASDTVELQVIRAIHKKMIDSWNAGDATGFASSFIDDADFVAFESTHLKGREEIIMFHQRIFDTVVKGSHIKGEVKFVRFLSPELAVMHSAVAYAPSGRTEALPSRDSMQLTVVTKQDGEWRSEVLMNAGMLAMERQLFLDEVESLSADGRRRVRGFVESLKAHKYGLVELGPGFAPRQVWRPAR